MAEEIKQNYENKQRSPTIAYAVFTYLDELSYKNNHHMLQLDAKFKLTKRLITSALDRTKDSTEEELADLQQCIVYRKKIKSNISKFVMWSRAKAMVKLNDILAEIQERIYEQYEG